MDKRVLPANIEMTATLSQQQAVVCGARSDDTSKSGSLLDIQRRKKAEQEERLSAFADWRLQTPVRADVADVTGIARAALTDREWEIVQHDAVSLLQGYSQGRYTVLEVTRAYCHAATVAHDLTNCLTEIFYDEGLARAEELDRHYKETGQMIGPLHGVPISIKDHILLRGHDTSSGYAGWAFDSRANRDAVMVAVLRQAGAILYLKTANPQTLLVSQHF
jgi:amidase